MHCSRITLAAGLGLSIAGVTSATPVTRPDLLPFGSMWRMQLSGETVPDGDEWSVSMDGVGWLHQFFFAPDNPIADSWVPCSLTIDAGRGHGGTSVSVYARREVRIAIRDFSTVRLTLRKHPAVGARVYINGALVHETNLDLPLILDNATTSASRAGDRVTVREIDGRHFGARGVVIVAVELHGPRGEPFVEPAADFDLRLVPVGHLPMGSLDVLMLTAPKVRSREETDVALGKIEPAEEQGARRKTRSRRSAVTPLPFEMGSTWRVSDDGSDQGTAWRAPAFDPSGWLLADGEFGFGDSDEQYTLSNQSSPTFYFRKDFGLTAPEALRGIVRYDDGVVVYANGIEVFRSNMEYNRAVLFSDWATSTSDENEIGMFVIEMSRVVAGTNVLAVEVHNRSPTSSDVSFDLALAAVAVPPTAPTAPPPPLPAAPLPLAFGSLWQYKADGSDQGVAWRDAAFDATAWAVGPAELGFGDSDEATHFAVTWAATYYFRREILIDSPTPLLVDCIVDDGMVAYVNGVEIFRVRMGEGPVAFDDFAASTSHDNEEVNFEIEASALVPGTNVVAIEVHNRDGSSDVSFDLAMIVRPPDPTVVRTGATWRYWDGVIAAAPVGWAAPSFDASAWPSGMAPLGYASDEVTTLQYGPDDEDKPITTYFRRTVEGYALVTSAGTPLRPCVSEFVGRLVVDDAVAIFVEGVEVYRHNLPAGPISPSTRASTVAVGSTEAAVWTFTVPATLVPDGSVTVAAEVHQASSSSSDLHFELSLVPNLCGCAAHFSATFAVARPPYLQQLYSTSAIVRWDSSTVALASIEYGTAPGALDRTAVGVCTAGVTHKHSVQLSGLAPATVYYYVLVGDSAGTVYSFTTQAARADITNFNVWFLADAGTGDGHQRAVRDAFDASYPGGPDLMILGGDNAYNDGKEMEYEVAVFQMYTKFLRTAGVWSTLGNHDARSADSDTLSGVHFDSFEFPRRGEGNHPTGGVPSGTEAYYSFDHGVAHFVCLDSEDSDKDPAAPMATWLAADLARAKAAGQQWLVAFWHHPPYSNGSHDSDSESSLVRMREVFVPILEAGGLDVAMCGHSHGYERSHFIDGHHGHSSTFREDMHVVQTSVGGPQAPYTKPAGLEPARGAVYVVAGSAGKVSSSGSLDHITTAVSHRTHGSLILEISRTAASSVLDAKFLTAAGDIADHFRIVKPLPQIEEVCVEFRGRRPWQSTSSACGG